MDFERDYILRMIQMMGDFMRRVAEKLDDIERGRMLDAESRRLCGVPFHTGEALDTQSLTELLPPVPRFMMSELLYVKAETDTGLPYGGADALRLKALRLLASLHGEARLCDLRAARLLTLKEAVYPLLSPGDLMDCARFFAQAERYDAMEDALFQARGALTGVARAAASAEGAALLRRAAKAPEAALALCGMGGQELREAARELETDIT
jgi:hypothetical protein